MDDSFKNPDDVRRTFPGLLIAATAPHTLELRHPDHAQPLLELSFAYADALPQGQVRCAGYRQRFHSLPGGQSGRVEEESAFDDEDEPSWVCDWDDWVRQWCQALLCAPPRLVKPGRS